MFQTLVNAWKIADLRKKILYTLLLLVIFRFGSVIPVPGLAPEALSQLLAANDNTLFSFFNNISGGAFEQTTIFAMSISPYINSSIIMNLLTVAVPSLERLSKEGEEGKKKIAQYTRYLTIVLAFIQAAGLYAMLGNYNAIETPGTMTFITITLTFCAGTAFLMWLGEKITEKGIGNGISILIFVGIISRLPAAVEGIGQYLLAGVTATKILWVAAILVLALLIIGFVVFINDGERRIPVQYAKRVQGRKMYGGQSTHVPLKVCLAGVIPIIFAMSILSFPQTIATMLGKSPTTGFWGGFMAIFQQDHWVYAVLYFLLIIFFTYFYTSIQFNPVEMANNMKANGGFVPGLRPGKPTSDYISKVLSKVTLIGAFALGIVALIPIVMGMFNTGLNISMGGTSILIVVSVALETVKQLESQMLMRHYKGFLE